MITKWKETSFSNSASSPNVFPSSVTEIRPVKWGTVKFLQSSYDHSQHENSRFIWQLFPCGEVAFQVLENSLLSHYHVKHIRSQIAHRCALYGAATFLSSHIDSSVPYSAISRQTTVSCQCHCWSASVNWYSNITWCHIWCYTFIRTLSSTMTKFPEPSKGLREFPVELLPLMFMLPSIEYP